MTIKRFNSLEWRFLSYVEGSIATLVDAEMLAVSTCSTIRRKSKKLLTRQKRLLLICGDPYKPER
jgi:hypothetical protein